MTDELRIPSGEFITTFNALNQQHLLALKKTTGSYRIVKIETQTGTETSLHCCDALDQALISFFTRIIAELGLDPQILTIPMSNIESQITGEDQSPTPDKKHGTFSLTDPDKQSTANMSASKPQQGKSDVTTPAESPLHPSAFYATGKAPEWLEATKNFLDLNAGTNIVKGEHYKLLAMNLKEKLYSHESIIHLQDRHGKLIDLTLAQICQSFRSGCPQHWKYKQTRT